MIRRFGLFALVGLLGLGAGLRDGFDRWVDETVVPPVLVETSTEMRDQRGALMRVFPVEDGRVRLAVALDQVDPGFIAMLLAYEDKRFYRHSGVDPLAILRAAGQAIWQGEIVSGGSTLTMQVARLLENSGTGRWHGKLRQIRLALALERQLDKDQILSLYLLHAPYGGAVEGVRAGSLAWFGKEPARLTTAEAALLVALPQAPEARRPDRHPARADAARARVLYRTQAAAQDHLPELPDRMVPFVRRAPHLTDRIAAEDPFRHRFDLTLDAQLQAQLEALAAHAVRGQPRGVSAAMLVADHRTGAILASVGSPQYAAIGGTAGFVDMTRAVRSPGSTLKPFVYGLAFDQGLAHPETLINDAPAAFGRYAPQNFDGQFRGELTVREALQLSLNIPPVLLTQELGAARLMAGLRAGGAVPRLQGKPGLAVALGGVGLTLADLVQLYGALPQGGQAAPLYVMQGGAQPPRTPMMSRAAAWQVSHILASIAPPSGTAARAGQIAYKTGTSYGHRDAWAIGFDGSHVIGVWLGRPDGTPVPGAFGGDLAAPILFEAFGRLKSAPDPLPAPPPETLIVSTAALPAPLQRFRPRDAVFAGGANRPVVTFPPDGAVLRRGLDGVSLKLRAGVLPLTVLVDGAPVVTGLQRRDVLLPLTSPGFSRISVIDAKGRAAQVQIRLD
ncbi:penicillin-binding protein 1C [Sulfitobacter mediterraneus]|uniref:penicillin-binding protein 1C n=1 Tax=Sulfitobacter mediterraneus TaxID=83219 RepID=UPI00193AA8A4|nr:penicillin-binding protein 1C [Sulfitobacter mediterraneus]MBM1555191.1 penicillin-binding protein 1C [Sulfitobacter mediterraneus]MBM1567256.1 penicillin-binding protein 1C [Sulfitobacter mediterraneus]MBM1571058.1 penicillin-binding protein 1C [Sulfitobacter mediterraneus]MBM1574858.1 penicillin-binding protein 1C [Sulfitobacter mediterraneus]MBM1578149.1 penicillin-binding protein 1C [Sulfitobacter mediterraneus]